MNRQIKGLIMLTTTIFCCCKKSYSPVVVSTGVNYLVVEGVINSGADSTIIKLSRTVRISGSTTHNPELGATVLVVNDGNATYPLRELGDGKYFALNLNLDTTHKYHLYIRTASGKEYASDPEPVKVNPPIDSIGYVTKNDGMQLYVNTHDPKNNTHYYRWEYTETWQFHAFYVSYFVTDGTKMSYRKDNQFVYWCFASDTSSTTLLGSSASLSSDEIYQSPLTQIASTSEKIELKYSIKVKQYALTGEAFNFWQNIKRNTEKIGSIFDVQPSEIQGNIHCITTPTEPVIGYISVTNVQQKRIFINNDALPQTWVPEYPYQCSMRPMLYDDHGQNDVALFLIPIPPAQLALFPFADSFGNVSGFMATDPPCADCTVRGVTKQPNFWK